MSISHKRDFDDKHVDEYTKNLLYAYHEAGHAVVGHVIGRFIEEVSIASSGGQYRGYCRFNSWVESMNNYIQWHESSGNPEIATIYYAGMLGMGFFCSQRGWEEWYLEGSEQDDFRQINEFFRRFYPDKTQRDRIKDECWHQAQEILSTYWDAVDELAARLLEQGQLMGREAHEIIRRSIGEVDADWRVEA